MSLNNSKFVISKGVENTFIFTIKQDNSTLPLSIVQGTDSFTADLILLADDTKAISNKPLTIIDPANGKVSLVLAVVETDALIASKGSEVDRFYLRPTYKLVISCNTVGNGKFIAKVAEVFID